VFNNTSKTMSKERKAMTGATNFLVEVRQNMMDELLDATAFPLTIVEHTTPFPSSRYGLAGSLSKEMAMEEDPSVYFLNDEEVDQLLQDADGFLPDSRKAPDAKDEVTEGILFEGGRIVQEAKDLLRRMDADPDVQVEGITKAELEAIVNGGVKELRKSLGRFPIAFHCPLLRVQVLKRPSVSLGVPTTKLADGKVKVTATGEMWIKVPKIVCKRWCTRWSITWKWVRAASITVSVELSVAASVNVFADGPRVVMRAAIDRLRLDYPILRNIPLEGIANRILGGKLVYVFDASRFVASIPVIETKFTVGGINLPTSTGAITVEVDATKI
jgi:hypothetical protein